MIVDIHTHNPYTTAQTIETVGIHPWHALEGDISAVEQQARYADAIGEIGLDYACDTPRALQESVFRAQLAIAERLQKPVVLHSVRAFEDTMRIVGNFRLTAVIFHGFIGSKEQAQRAINEGYYLSFGDCTFRSRKTIEALLSTPLTHLFIETDESATPIEDIYEKIASMRSITVDELTVATEKNYNLIFNS